MSGHKGRGRRRTRGRDPGWSRPSEEREVGTECVSLSNHPTRDPDELGKLNETLQIISKKDHRWFIKKGLSSNNCWRTLPSSGSKLLKAEESLEHKETHLYTLCPVTTGPVAYNPQKGKKEETAGLKLKKCLRSVPVKTWAQKLLPTISQLEVSPLLG